MLSTAKRSTRIITLICLVLIASLVECFLILPAHMNHALSASKKQRWYDMPNRVFNRDRRG